MQKVHMLGIGGAGMAALAVMLKDMGLAVSGYDRDLGNTAKRLLAMGIPVTDTNDSAYLSEADLCVYSAAFGQDHPLVQYAKKHMPTYSRGEMMGGLSSGFATVAAVAGTHGKTTVCGRLTTILLGDGKDPSVLMGGHLPLIGANGRLGSRSLLVCEACEYAGSFLYLNRDVGVLLNVDNDHLEWYGSMERLKKGFADFTAPCRVVIVCGEDANAMDVTAHHPYRLCYGFDKTMDCYATELQEQNGRYAFMLHLPDRVLPIRLQVPGQHNLLNAMAAALTAWHLGASAAAIQKGLNGFKGVARRFEILHADPVLTIADDYAHHPAEIASVLQSASKMGFSRITAVFQPFTYSRTLALYKEFAAALQTADRVIFPPIMGGREQAQPGVTSGLIATGLPNAVLCNDLSHAARLALQNRREKELILTMGCGDVYKCAEKMVQMVKSENVCGETA